MTTTISERATAYRSALRDALNDGRSIKVATELAKEAARGVSNLPQQKPIILTDAELRLIDGNELTAEESDRLDELDQLTVKAEDSLSGGKSAIIKEIAAALGIPIVNVELSHSDDCPACSDPFCMGDCPSEDTMTNVLGWREQEMAKAKLIDAWHNGIVTPAGLRVTAKANFMADLGEDLDEECPTTRHVRDCDVPATLRAIDIPATEDHGSIQQWFDGEDEMHQFLCALKVSLYAGTDRSIKDQDGKPVGMWFYAHFGPTPVS